MKLEPLQYRSESPVQGMSDRQQESRGFNPVRKSKERTIQHDDPLFFFIRLRRNTPCFSYGDIRRLCLT